MIKNPSLIKKLIEEYLRLGETARLGMQTYEQCLRREAEIERDLCKLLPHDGQK